MIKEIGCFEPSLLRRRERRCTRNGVRSEVPHAAVESAQHRPELQEPPHPTEAERVVTARCRRQNTPCSSRLRKLLSVGGEVVHIVAGSSSAMEATRKMSPSPRLGISVKMASKARLTSIRGIWTGFCDSQRKQTGRQATGIRQADRQTQAGKATQQQYPGVRVVS